jgi:thymidylate kinase
MIINIRGTSGSGKSTLVRKVMELYKEKAAIHVDGRKQPIAYSLQSPETERDLFVPGHYETACGGCDTINGLDKIYDLVTENAVLGNVLFEGLIVCSDFRRMVELREEFGAQNVLVIGLDTPVDVCLASVQERRAARGNDKPLNPKNTESKFKTNRRVLERFEEAGVPVVWLSREEAFERIKKEFGL